MADTRRESERLRPNARAKAAALREKERKREARRRLLTAGGAVVAVLAVIAVLVVVRVTTGNKSDSASPGSSSLDPAVATAVRSVPAATFDAVGAGTVQTWPKAISGPALTAGGKPKVVYIGANYCPFCAVERWPLVVALARFGTWQNLSATTSAPAPEVHPNTPTFSFHGAGYSSPYVAFEGVETNTNKSTGNGFEPLDAMTAEQQKLLQTYQPGGSIPFVDFGNKYMIGSASYDPEVLKGKSMNQIADALKDPSSPVAKGVVGTANGMTAAICTLTGNKPAAVCTSPAVTAVRGKLGR